MNEEILVSFGGEIKSLGQNKIGGLLVRFSSKSAPDLAGDYFDKDTDFGFEGTIKTPVYLNHRLPLATAKGRQIVVKQKIGEGTLTKSDDGILIEAILYNRKQYEKALSSMGWSSGTANHLVDRTKTGKSFHVDTWPLGLDASLTPEPCDPDNICSLKAYAGLEFKSFVVEDGEPEPAKSFKGNSLASRLSQHIEDLIEDGKDRGAVIKSLASASMMSADEVEQVLSGEIARPSNSRLKAFARVLGVPYDALKSLASRDHQQTIKGMFEEALADNVPSRWQMDSVYCEVLRKIANVAQASKLTGVDFDMPAKVKEATAEYLARLESYAVTQIGDFVESGSDEQFYLKAIIKLCEEDVFAAKHLDLDDHSDLAVSALKEVTARFRANHEARKSQKAGRVLSQRNRERLAAMLEQIKTAVSDCQTLLDESQPMANEADMSTAKTAFMHAQWRAKQMGANLS